MSHSQRKRRDPAKSARSHKSPKRGRKSNQNGGSKSDDEENHNHMNNVFEVDKHNRLQLSMDGFVIKNKNETSASNTLNGHTHRTHSKSLSKGMDEWEGWKTLESSDGGNRMTISLKNKVVHQASFDKLQLSKKPKLAQKQTPGKSMDIWMSISLKQRVILHCNLYEALSLLDNQATNEIELYLRPHTVHVGEFENASQIKAYQSNAVPDTQDILLKIHYGDANDAGFYHFVHYLCRQKPGDVDIPHSYKTLNVPPSTPATNTLPPSPSTSSASKSKPLTDLMKQPKSARSRYSSRNSNGFTPTLSVPTNSNNALNRNKVAPSSTTIARKRKSIRNGEGTHFQTVHQPDFNEVCGDDDTKDDEDNNIENPDAAQSDAYDTYLDARKYNVDNPHARARRGVGSGSKRARATQMASLAKQHQEQPTKTLSKPAQAALSRHQQLALKPVNSTPAVSNNIHSELPINRLDLQVSHFKSKQQSKQADYAQPGKRSGGFYARKTRGRKTYESRRKNGKLPIRSGSGNKQNAFDVAGEILGGPSTSFKSARSGSSSSGLLSRAFSVGRSGDLIGFRNLGNTCYLNAILRSITSLKCVSRDLRRKYIFYLGGDKVSRMYSLYRAYIALLFEDLENSGLSDKSNGKMLNPAVLKEIIGSKEQMFASYRQQDAHELLSFLLNALHDEVYKAILTQYGYMKASKDAYDDDAQTSKIGEVAVKQEETKKKQSNDKKRAIGSGKEEMDEDDDDEEAEDERTMDVDHNQEEGKVNSMMQETDSEPEEGDKAIAIQNGDSNNIEVKKEQSVRSEMDVDDEDNANTNPCELSKEELEWLSPIHSNFHFQIEFQYECTKCGYKRNKVESFREMSLDLPHKNVEEEEEKKAEETKEDPEPEDEEKQEEVDEKCRDKQKQSSPPKQPPPDDKGKDDEKSLALEDDIKADEKAPEQSASQRFTQHCIQKASCPVHQTDHLFLNLTASPMKAKMTCTKCNNALLDTFDVPDDVAKEQGIRKSNGQNGSHMHPKRRLFANSNAHQTPKRSYQAPRINQWTLTELLKAYFVKKKLEYKCDNKGCHNNKVYVTSWFKQIPRVLILHIKRFIPNYYTNSYTKSHDKVQIDKSLNIKLFCNRQLSLPPGSFDDDDERLDKEVTSNSNQSTTVSHDADTVYAKLFDKDRNQKLWQRDDALNVYENMQDLPIEMKQSVKLDDFKREHLTSKKSQDDDDDDDVVILPKDHNHNHNHNHNHHPPARTKIPPKIGTPVTPTTPDSDSQSEDNINVTLPEPMAMKEISHSTASTVEPPPILEAEGMITTMIEPDLPHPPEYKAESELDKSDRKLINTLAQKYGALHAKSPAAIPPSQSESLLSEQSEPGAVVTDQSDKKEHHNGKTLHPLADSEPFAARMDENQDEEKEANGSNREHMDIDTGKSEQQQQGNNTSNMDIMSKEEMSQSEIMWANVDPIWKETWNKDKCQRALRDPNQPATMKEYASMYLRYWISKEHHERNGSDHANANHNPRKRTRADYEDGAAPNSAPPRSKRQKTDECQHNKDVIPGGCGGDGAAFVDDDNSTKPTELVNIGINDSCAPSISSTMANGKEAGQQTIPQMLSRMVVDKNVDATNMNSNSHSNATTNSSQNDFERAIAESLQTAEEEAVRRKSNMECGGNDDDVVILNDEESQLQRVLNESLVIQNVDQMFEHEDRMNEQRNEELMKQDAKLGNSANIKKFRPVCDEQFLPNKAEWTQYRLQSIVRHLGSNYQCGHYITDVLETDGSDQCQWKRHDDQYVKGIDEQLAVNDIAQKNAYIFFYVHHSAK